jgi:hypothetical protein
MKFQITMKIDSDALEITTNFHQEVEKLPQRAEAIKTPDDLGANL